MVDYSASLTHNMRDHDPQQDPHHTELTHHLKGQVGKKIVMHQYKLIGVNVVS